MIFKARTNVYKFDQLVLFDHCSYIAHKSDIKAASKYWKKCQFSMLHC